LLYVLFVLGLLTCIHDRPLQPKIGIYPEEGSYNEGRIRCRFSRDINVNNEEVEEYSLLSKPWHLLMARGPSGFGTVTPYMPTL